MKPKIQKPTRMDLACVIIFIIIVACSLLFVALWSLGYAIKGIEIWVAILTTTVSFVIGYLMGQNKSTQN